MSGNTDALRVVTALAALAAWGCDASTPTGSGLEARGVESPALAQHATFAPEFDPTHFASVDDHPYPPLIPGTAYHHRGITPEGVEENDILVLYDNTKQILGVTVTVVHDLVSLDGVLKEETFDWYAQDNDGNVWYMGEDTKEFDGDEISTEGSWEAGVGENRPGIIMMAEPKTGMSYRQEFAPDVALDMARVLRLHAPVVVPFDALDDCIQIMEWTPLELGVHEHKFYCRDVGRVLEVHPGGGTPFRNELVSITHF